VELKKAHTRVGRITFERATKVERLSQQVVWVPGSILIDLGLLPVEDIP
jgi:hypothetical protein